VNSKKSVVHYALLKQNCTFEKNIDMSHDNHDTSHESKKTDTFFEGSTIGIGFVYTIIALAIIGSIYAFG